MPKREICARNKIATLRNDEPNTAEGKTDMMFKNTKNAILYYNIHIM